MTDIRAGRTYRAVLATPGALRFCLAGAVGRMPISMFSLGSLLLVAGLTGRYGLAGLVSAAGSVTSAVSSPQVARLADRYGQGRVLRPAALVFTAATAVFVATAELRAPGWAILVTGALAGGAMPSLGPMVRARWSALLGGTPDLDTAYALESIVDELIFVIGPAAVTLLATEVAPAAGVITATVLCAAGTLALAAQTGTEPAAVAPAAAISPAAAHPPAAPRPDGPQPDGPAPRGAPAPRWTGRLPAAGLVTLVPVVVFLGAMFATIDLSTVAFAQQHGHRPLAGFLLGTYALGSACGGLWYGARAWRAPLERRFAITLGLTAAGVATFWLVPGLAVLEGVVFVAGLAIAPTLIAAFSLVERQARPGRQTEGLAWVLSGFSVGLAAGSAVAGQVVDAGGGHWGYGLAGGWGALALACGLAGLGRLRAGAPAAEAGTGGAAGQDAPGGA